MRKVLFAVFALIFLVMSQAFAQDKTITGRVTAKDTGEGLPSVNIVVKGTTQGTVTDIEGNYKISVGADTRSLVYSFTGYATQEIEIGNRSSIDVVLAVEAIGLNEVVVVGYGTQQKRDISGSVTSVSAKEIQNVPVTSFEAAIQGRTTGVMVDAQSGKLGQGMKIRVRGSASLSASNQPLYVIDGIPVTQNSVSDPGTEQLNPLADLNPNDIESIDVLKDASSAAIYGARGANGVVIITTKRGKAGKTNFNVNVSSGSSRATGFRDFLNRDQYLELYEEANAATGYYDSFAEAWEDNVGTDFKEMIDGKYDTDWQSHAFRKGGFRQVDFTAGGGNEKTTFYTGLSYLDQKGIIISNAFERMSGRVNLDHKATDRLTFGTSLNLVRSINRRVDSDNSFTNPVQSNALPPIQPFYDPQTGELYRGTMYDNPFIQVAGQSQDATSYRGIANFYGSYRIIPGLVFRSEFGADYLNLVEKYFNGRTTPNGAPFGNAGYRTTNVINYTTNNTLTYNKTLAEKHDIEALIGMSFQESNTQGSNVYGQNFPSDNLRTLSSATVITGGDSRFTSYRFLSYFSRINYKFDARYLVSLSGRIDGSSRFGADNQYGFFPAASVGWVLSEESFLKDNVDAVNFAKIRASYGITGNSEISNYASRGQVITIANGEQSGVVQPTIGNPNLKWETTGTFDIGVDVGLFQDRVTATFDYYTKNTKDLLLSLNVPLTTGFSTQTRNIGSLKNKGVEFSINTRNTVGEFKWNTSVNISRNTNEITDLAGTQILPQNRMLSAGLEGHPIGVFYGKKFVGVDPENGDALYEGENGTPTNDITQAPNTILGDPTPDFYGGFTNTFSYKGLELSAFFQFVYGNDVYNMAGVYQSASADFFDNQTVDQMNRWRKPGDITMVPQARLFGGNGVGTSSRWMEDGSYMRLKTLTLSYTLPKNLISRAKMSNVRLYVTGQNVLTFTKYSGYDPEVSYQLTGSSNQTTNITQGHDFYTPPQAKTWIFGVNIGF